MYPFLHRCVNFQYQWLLIVKISKQKIYKWIFIRD
jgi:hypothetical protein